MGLGRKVFGSETLSSAELQGYLMDQAVMAFTGSAQRGTEVPAPEDGMVCYLQDADTFYGRVGGVWRRLSGDVTLGEAYLVTASSVTVGSGAGWTDLATVTATCGPGDVVARWNGTLQNGASGAERTGTFRVLMDAVVMGTYGPFPVPLGNSSYPRIYKAGHYVSAPGAGQHTWKLQAQGSAPSSVVSEAAQLRVVEKG